MVSRDAHQWSWRIYSFSSFGLGELPRQVHFLKGNKIHSWKVGQSGHDS